MNLHKKMILFGLCILLFISLIGCQSQNNDLNNKIISAIDNKCKQANTCQILMKDITDFKWDKMAIYQVGSSKVEISKALGVEYKGSIDLMSGIIFVYNNKIVHEEKVSYNPEKPSKLAYVIEKQQQEPNCISYTLENALFNGSREKIDGVFYYKITATTKKDK